MGDFATNTISKLAEDPELLGVILSGIQGPQALVSNVIGLEALRRQRTRDDARKSEDAKDADFSRILGQLGTGGGQFSGFSVPQMSIGALNQIDSFTQPPSRGPITVDAGRF